MVIFVEILWSKVTRKSLYTHRCLETVEDPDTGDLGDLDVSFGITGIEIVPTVDNPLPDNTAFPLYNGQR